MKPALSVDLNCDLGESFGAYHIGNDAAMLDVVTSANIACGFHAGDPLVMQQTVQLALAGNVAIGAHPGLPDLQGFGRREIKVTPAEVYAMVVYQVGALAAFVQAAGGTLHHVKPHGALYNMAAANRALAEAVATAVSQTFPEAVLYGLAGSELIKAGDKLGIRTANEVFADRTYQQNGTLTPRSHPDALITETDMAVRQVLRMVQQGKVKSVQGTEVALQADTICIHGDGPHAVSFAKAIREALVQEGVQLSER